MKPEKNKKKKKNYNE